VGVVVVAAIVVRIGGRSAADVLGVRLRFWRARRRGWTQAVGRGCSPTTPAPQICPACWPRYARWISTTAAGRRHVLLHNRRTGTLTAILRCAPIGLDLGRL
jgi:hypothetical protein